MAYAEVNLHNKMVLESLEEGDLVEFTRTGNSFSHWGVYVGCEKVVHLTPETSQSNGFPGMSFHISGMNSERAIVKEEDFRDIVKEDYIAKKNNDKDMKHRPLSRAEIKHRAKSKIGETSYNLIWRNCEHFASWCRNGVELSEQVDTGLMWTVGIGAAAVAIGLINSFFKQKKN